MTADTRNKENRPSRTELEQSLGGNRSQARAARRTSAKGSNPDLQLESQYSRRQQVLGGDLTGISRRGQKRGLFARLAAVNYVNWIAIGIVIAILAVFFWPHEKSNAVREVNTETASEVVGYQGLERTDETPVESDSFSKNDDLQRATEFRLEDQQQRQVNMLLNAARAHVSAGEYSQPPGDNAVSKFNQILQIDSRNRAAREGLEFIRGRFLVNGLEALEANDLDGANQVLDRLRDVDQDSSEASELSTAIAEFKTQQQTNELLAKAQTAFAAQKFILPARANALYFYQQVIELDAQNVAALKGIDAIADEFVRQANAAVIAGELQAAAGYLATVSVIDPQHPSISMIETMIERARPLANRAPSVQEDAADNSSESASSNANETQSSQPENADSGVQTSLPRRPERVSNQRTPESVAREREAFDRQYLDRGLNAYYRGEYAEAIGLLQPLADKGIARAQFRIGYMHFLGRGFPANRTTADEIIRAALPAIQKFAEEGRAWAQSDLGSLYEEGLVVRKDYADALYWYRSAAEQGYPGAQTNLGVMYARGLGVPASRKTAIEWFQRAAKQGDITARNNLETLGVQP